MLSSKSGARVTNKIQSDSAFKQSDKQKILLCTINAITLSKIQVCRGKVW